MHSDVTKITSIRKRKFTDSARLSLTAVSVMGFVGIWHFIGRLENNYTNPNIPPAQPTPTYFPLSQPKPSPTPWPTLTFIEIPPMPATVEGLDTDYQGLSADNAVSMNLQQIIPLPTLPALPTLAPLPTLPAPPPPPPPAMAVGGGGNSSGGS